MFLERRGSKRVRKRLFLKSLVLGPKEYPCVDISLHGLMIESTKFLEIGKRVNVELITPDGKPMRCETKVSWAHPKIRAASLYKIGLEFINLSPENRERLSRAIHDTPSASK